MRLVQSRSISLGSFAYLVCCDCVIGVSFQMSILKILAGQPDGQASLAVVKQYLAVFYCSGSEWTDRMKRLAQRAPNLDIFGQKLIIRERGEWRITDEGQALLLALEHSSAVTAEEPPSDQPIEHLPIGEPPISSAPPHRRIAGWKRGCGGRGSAARQRRLA